MKNVIDTGIKIIGGIAALGTFFWLCREVVLKDDLKKYTELSSFDRHEEVEREKIKNLTCFVCRLPELAKDSKCAENCSASASFEMDGKSYEAVIVKDPSVAFREPAVNATEKSITISSASGELERGIRVTASNGALDSGLFYAPILTENGRPIAEKEISKIVERAAASGIVLQLKPLKIKNDEP